MSKYMKCDGLILAYSDIVMLNDIGDGKIQIIFKGNSVREIINVGDENIKVMLKLYEEYLINS